MRQYGLLCGVVCALWMVAGCDESQTAREADVGADTSMGSNDTGAGEETLEEVVEPPAATSYLYDPVEGSKLYSFPDDYYTDASDSSLTGLQVRIDEEIAPWLKRVPSNLYDAHADLGELDGWGTTADLFLRFTEALSEPPSGPEVSVTNDALMLVELLPEGGAVRVPFEAKLIDRGKTILITPLIPLTPKQRHGVIVTREMLDANEQPIEAGPVLASLLEQSATDPRLASLAPRYEALLSAVGMDAANVSAATVFTTQSIFDESEAIASDIRGRDYVWNGAPNCTQRTGYRVCAGQFEAQNYRSPEGVVVDGTPQSTYTLSVNLYLPDGDNTWPIHIFGHGLGGDRTNTESLIQAQLFPNTALVGIDAVGHGAHPTSTGADGMAVFEDFFAVEINTLTFDPLRQRDNWRQSTYDKLQLMELLRDNPDVDGDGTADLNGSFNYTGISLGAIMGSELLALDAFDSALLSVGGGRVVSILSESESFGSLIGFVKPPNWSDGDLARAFPLAQTILDRADPANYAAHVLKDRLSVGGTQAPHMLMLMAVGDEVVPNVATLALARAMGIPVLPPVVTDPGLLPLETSLPVSGNLENGTLTAGFFQYDRVTYGAGYPAEAAQHGEMHGGREFFVQARHFCTTLTERGVPEIMDPYAHFDTPALNP